MQCRLSRRVVYAAACFGFLLSSPTAALADEVLSFTEAPGWPTYNSTEVNRSLSFQNEKFLVHVPSGVNSQRSVGLLVYIPAVESLTDLPAGWAEILDRNQFVFIAPQNAGNSQDSRRRAGLAVMAAMGMLRKYRNIDTKRIFMSGFSGGARIASAVAFNQADLVRGAILNCGSDFPQRVVWHNAQPQTSQDRNYGFCTATAQECQWAKTYVRFALITGGDDFRRSYLQDLYNDGYRRYGFQVRLFDVPDLGHNVCDGRTLQQALDFVSTGR